MRFELRQINDYIGVESDRTYADYGVFRSNPALFWFIELLYRH